MDSTVNSVINRIITEAAKRRASHIHLAVGANPALRIDESLIDLDDEAIVAASFIKALADGWLTPEQIKELELKREVIVVKDHDKNFRLRMNFFYQRRNLTATIRLISTRVLPLSNLGLPKAVYALTEKKNGLVIVCGPYGSGRTTTVASMLEEINSNRKENILTVEKPIEYFLTNKKSVIQQREVGTDVNFFTDALEYADQTDIDVIAVGLNSEREVIALSLNLANAGRLVFLVMDTTNVIQTIEEILASFKPQDKSRAQELLSDNLHAIVAQRLVPRTGGGLVLAAEVLINNEATKNMIREGRLAQLTTIMQTSRADGMTSLDQSLAELVKSQDVLVDQAVNYSQDAAHFRTLVRS